MAVNKVIYGSDTVIDLTSDTVAANKMLSGTTAHDKSGALITGNIPSKTSADLTASGATVTVPAGHYASQASKSIATGALSNPTINNSTGIVTAQVGTSGYLASGTSKTLSLTPQGAQTITPGTTDQTIAANRWLTGAQTIKGDANLVPGNIKSGVTIFGKTGTHSGGSPNLQSKSVTYTSNGSATVTPDAGYDGLSQVNVTVNVSGGGGVTALENLSSINGQFYGSESGGNLFGSLNLIECDWLYVGFLGCAFTNIMIDSCSFQGGYFENVSFANTIFIDTDIGDNIFAEGVTFLGATINGKTGTQADAELIQMIVSEGGNALSPITLPSGATYTYLGPEV